VNELQRIVMRTRHELDARRERTPLAPLRERAAARLQRDPVRDFTATLAAPGLSVIAEHKRRSPSAGAIRTDLELEDVVAAYEHGGARALSVLTERAGFGGSIEDLTRARAAATLPILRKDFIVDEYQVVEAVAAGADAILLIVAALDPAALRSLYELATGYGLGVLVEVHDVDELTIAAAIEPAVIGINNRDLTTLEVDTARTLQLLASAPAGALTVSESGLRAPADVAAVAAAGVDAVLVGEALMRSGDIEAACRALVGAAAPAPTMDG
jgi:indole-3-glycerol phosphate synthase